MLTQNLLSRHRPISRFVDTFEKLTYESYRVGAAAKGAFFSMRWRSFPNYLEGQRQHVYVFHPARRYGFPS